MSNLNPQETQILSPCGQSPIESIDDKFYFMPRTIFSICGGCSVETIRIDLNGQTELIPLDELVVRQYGFCHIALHLQPHPVLEAAN